MTDFLLIAALVVLATMASGLVPILRNHGDAERMMAAQLLGTGGVAALLLGGVAAGVDAVLDVALILALLAAFAAIAFVKRGSDAEMPDDATPADSGKPWTR